MPIYYESRISKLGLNASELPKIDAEFEEITEGEEWSKKEQLKTKWAALEALVGDPKRIALIAADLVAHFEKRLEAMDGKAMIVCMSRRICVDLHNAIVALRPDWAGAKDDDTEAEKGKACVVKVIMTGSAADGSHWQPHIRNNNRAISTMEVIEELIRLAQELDAATQRGEQLGLTDDEVAFYDALAANGSAVEVMGDAKLKVIATELITKVRQSVTIDWTLRESSRAKIRVLVKRILNKYGYPPDLQEEAVKTVLQQAELLCNDWAGV